MKNKLMINSFHLTLLLACFSFTLFSQKMYAGQMQEKNEKIIGVRQLNPTSVEVLFSNDQRAIFDFYGEMIFRVFRDNSGGIVRDPIAQPEAKILVENPRRPVGQLNVQDENGTVCITTAKIEVRLNKETSLMSVSNLQTGAVVLEEIAPVGFNKDKVTITLKENPGEYFYGGGVQNGRFSHKGMMISIENQNSWTDGGVASPTPFYWSTKGYGMMWYTFNKGKYDFGAEKSGEIRLSHDTDYLDVFYMVGDGAVALLNGFYQLTGNPVLLPKFGFYEGHLNAYNRDFWKEDPAGILFEDGKRYKESQKDNGGTKESLNGEKNNYQFSARAVIDRYKQNDMPLGWILPNDGYGAGYGQTETLDGNIQNLKSFGEYARQHGVEIGLWTQSDLHPKKGVEALLQRDIVKEVRDAGVRVLKTDVAWVGAGYSFGLNGVADVAHIMPYYGADARPFVISLDGWAGTQRYAGIWSGDQTGGQWEYIRFHIPTYIGSGLSGQPNISSDMDGIFGGKKGIINARDFQWKTFSPMELNMDGWGANEKYPQALGEPYTSINRWYLKLKSELLPYSYSIAQEAVSGKPMIRAMFLDEPNTYTLGVATQYQYLYGPYFLVAPIYKETRVDEKGNDIRNHIYLSKGSWVDYFTGDIYEGGRVINDYDAPLWKLPVFVRNGAIIPMANHSNNVSEIDRHLRIYEIYPFGETQFTEYDDDGETEAYKLGKYVTTQIESKVLPGGRAVITIYPAKGEFEGFAKDKKTEFRVNVTAKPKKVEAKIGKRKIRLTEASSMDEFLSKENAYFYDEAPNLNKFATKGSEFENNKITKNPQLLVKLQSADITTDETTLNITGFSFAPDDKLRVTTGSLSAPQATVTEENTGSYTLKPTWEKVDHADYYELMFDSVLYTTIKDTNILFENLSVDTKYDFKIRAVNKEGYSDWAEFTATTKRDPLEFAIRDIAAVSTAKDQEGAELYQLVNWDERDTWHTKYRVNQIPLDIVLDLKTVNQLDKIQYVPRIDGGNGTFRKGTVYYSMDKEKWTEAGSFSWTNDGQAKQFDFSGHPQARYIKVNVSEAIGGYGSGRQLYVFKVPGTASYLPGDINNDGKIDENDLTSYMNYVGLRKGDGDFEGYISNGDINKNGLIDAYDISVVTTQLQEGVKPETAEKASGKLEISSDKQRYAAGETVTITVKGTNLQSVNALSFALPYDPEKYEFVGIELLQMKKQENLTKDRLHTNGTKALYPTFANIGNVEVLDGSLPLFMIRFKAKSKLTFDLRMLDGLLVDRQLGVHQF